MCIECIKWNVKHDSSCWMMKKNTTVLNLLKAYSSNSSNSRSSSSIIGIILSLCYMVYEDQEIIVSWQLCWCCCLLKFITVMLCSVCSVYCTYTVQTHTNNTHHPDNKISICLSIIILLLAACRMLCTSTSECTSSKYQHTEIYSIWMLSVFE